MTRSVYIIGGAGAGKSTFTAELLTHLPELGPPEELHSRRNIKNLVKLRGHRIGTDGMYLGVMRDHPHPGTDGLDRACHQVGMDWLFRFQLPQYILGEGRTLGMKNFLGALAVTTDLTLIHLRASAETRALRYQDRGTQQNENFIQGTVTGAVNLANYLGDSATVHTIDSEDAVSWKRGIECSLEALLQ